MGVTLQAMVEIHVESDPEIGTRARWESQASFEFNKDYPLMAVLDARVQPGWPKDLSFWAERVRERSHHGEQWATNVSLSQVRFDRSTWRAFQAYLSALTKEGARVRVLFYRT